MNVVIDVLDGLLGEIKNPFAVLQRFNDLRRGDFAFSHSLVKVLCNDETCHFLYSFLLRFIFGGAAFSVMEIKRNYLRLISRTMAVVAAAVMAAAAALDIVIVTAAAFAVVMVTRGSKKNIFSIPYLLRVCLLVAAFSGRGRRNTAIFSE